METLDVYKWSGHAVLMGRGLLAGQFPGEVLHMFNASKRAARKKYRNFVADGIALGKREELVGGGLKRYLKFSVSQVYESFDDRILGN